MKGGLAILGFFASLAQPLLAEGPPPLVQVYREQIKAGAADVYSRVEEDVARICARVKCPNPYLALEAEKGEKEIWWLNTFASEADRERVVKAYDQEAVREALRDIPQRKQGLATGGRNVIATRRDDLCDGSSWQMTGARFFVITESRVDFKAVGCVFQSRDGTRFGLAPVASRRAADRVLAKIGATAKLYAVRPEWSLPDARWVSADPDFWNRVAR